MNAFKNKKGQIRNVWWIIIFFLVLASLTIPMVFISQAYEWDITMYHQVIIVLVTTLICQFFRKKPVSELTGEFNKVWLENLLRGMGIGAALMLLPALILSISGQLNWNFYKWDWNSFITTTALTLCVAVAEEFLFRGFLFQRTKDWLGIWGAQLLLAAYFLLTHMNNPGMTGNIKLLASVNIFIASIMFGFAYLKTKSLAMPIGLHFMSNWVQGTVLGFGVSGHNEYSLLKPTFQPAPEWLTGSDFGLEASLPGLACVIITVVLLYKWKPSSKDIV
ncbi:hypothetical protein FCR2A7T_24180 [Flavobacterium cauense R2A-7]|uniref:CAAX prenyl protease 2/Lysostaphin resistance protein A-like domain-containing protein n=1 Tax=Flavobacterium cauense R2A-7 TaxID=1341154 RepID=V6RWZ1_9FLAO|nr:type II CAAX endopeptidase family protein [Flavobacterium cauense]ESU19006.1 hypothetical protein FCR2A7T_24180 [Flavobacterium cauense R2A-7]KGO82364.1 hypothetical protein Q762_06720 [Flavobacterium cauense R2A-7]TWI15331.1 hypothetical protein IP98_00323 [Flavobacterium cauense R2A-7]